jgi:hypothetical protein
MPIQNEVQLEQALTLLATKLDEIRDRMPGPHTEQSGIPTSTVADELRALLDSFQETKPDALAVVDGEFDEGSGAPSTPPADGEGTFGHSGRPGPTDEEAEQLGRQGSR